MRLYNSEKTKVETAETVMQNSVPWSKRFLDWTGFADKKLWDFLQFIFTAAVPIVLTIWSMQQAEIARVQEDQNQQRNEDNQRAKIMSDYLDAMTKYLLEDPTKVPDINKANKIARARTLNTLRQLDPDRKGQLLKFLYEASLVTPCRSTTQIQGNNCQISRLDLSGARLDQLTFEIPPIMQGIELSSARLPDAKLLGIDLTNAQLEKANLMGADLSQSTLKGADMKSVVLQNAKLTDATLSNANLTNASLIKADLGGARLVEANLRGSDMSSANLNNAVLEKADLRGTNLANASLKNVNLKGAIYDEKTQFPEGFNREGQGMSKE